ncbi:MAG: energy transducer TonB [Gammaproteobacteria bacterium]
MNNAFNNLIIFNGYPLAVVVAVGLHVLLLAGLLYLQSNNEVEALELVQPTVITALFIDENPQVRNERVIERQRVQRQQEREEQQRAAEAAAAQQAREEAERQAAEQRAREQEAERQRQALVEREELERQRAEQERLRQERERQQEAERQRQQELDREQAQAAERQRQEEAARRREREAAEAAAAQAARNEFELVQSATGLIQQLVQEHWSRPPSARNGMRAIIQIRMLPTGELLDATITQSSGDAAFDRSAENAVYRAAPFSELQDLPINVFNANFRSLSLIFEPQDLLN